MKAVYLLNLVALYFVSFYLLFSVGYTFVHIAAKALKNDGESLFTHKAKIGLINSIIAIILFAILYLKMRSLV